MATGIEEAAVSALVSVVVDGGQKVYCYARGKIDSSNLEDNFNLLNETVSKLSAVKNDREAEVVRNKAKTVTHVYSVWKDSVLNIIIEAKRLIERYECKRPSIWKFIDRSDFSKQIAKKCVEVLKLLEESSFPEGFLVDKPPEPVLKLNAPDVKGFPTLQGPVDRILVLLKNHKIKVIGIRGVVGVGKTTVMQNLNNHEEVAKLFDMVIWLKVGSEGNEEKLQGLIAQRLKVNVDGITDPATAISEELKGRKCLLLLDDIVNHLNLDTVGVPYSNTGSKVVLTTNFPGVCKLMVDKVIEVHPLSENESWKMFQEIVIDVIDLPDIEPVARKVVKMCGRLPLLITKIASSFKVKDRVSLWRDALADLELWPQIEFQGLQEMYEFLTFCYNDLQEEDRKKCFLYGALYPAESKIYTDYLVECWACQGFLGNIGNSRKYQNVRDKGDTILEHLIGVSLLQKGERMIYVWMNSCIRQVALHILSCDPKAKFLVKNSEDVLEPTNTEYWHEAKWISMIGRKLKDLPESEDCSFLSTLLLQMNSKLTRIAQSFFVTMRSLSVLDLYSTGVVALPPSISNLTGLKGLYLNDCRQLTMLPPEVGELPLEVLDIRSSGITFIPSHMQLLIHLRCLRMSYNKVSRGDGSQRDKIKCNVISNLTRLEELIIDVDVMLYDEWCNEAADIISQVAKLENLTTLRICFPITNILKTFWADSQLWRAEQLTSFRFFIGCQTSKRPELLEFFNYKIKRYMKYCNGECNDDSIICNLLPNTLAFELIGHKDIKILSDFKGIAIMNEIRGFLIRGCNEIITILDGNKTYGDILPKLEQLYIRNVPNLQSIFVGSFSRGSLSKLQILELKSCNKLTKIFSNGVSQQLVELQKLTVEDCPEIEELIMKLESSGLNSSPVLPKLETLTLLNMLKLKAIYADKSLAWQSLKVLKIYGCPELKILPFSGGNATKLRAIEGGQQWWDGLQWETDEIKENLKKVCSLR